MTSAPYIRLGDLRTYADLQRKATALDEGGGQSVEWVTERKLWCRVREFSGQQKQEGMQRESSVVYEIQARYQDDVDPAVVTGKRVRHGDSVFNIVAAFVPGEVKEFVVMKAERGVAT